TIASAALAATFSRSSTRLSRNTAIEPVSNAAKATWVARHEAMNARAQQGHVDLICVGDSIVERYETQGKGTWDRNTLPAMRGTWESGAPNPPGAPRPRQSPGRGTDTRHRDDRSEQRRS